jgi:hypothetical protein
MENAKKNLVFHFGVGRQASFLKIGYVNIFGLKIKVKSGLEKNILKFLHGQNNFT